MKRTSILEPGSLSFKLKDAAKDEHDATHAHEHAHAAASQVTCVAAGAVCFILYFFFCIVFSAVIFTDLAGDLGVPEGVGIILLGISIGCLTFAKGSSCKAIIAGPDLLPVIFTAECGSAIKAYLEDQEGSQDKLIPTTLVAMIIGNVLTGVMFFTLGGLKKTSAAIGYPCMHGASMRARIHMHDACLHAYSVADRLRPIGCGW